MSKKDRANPPPPGSLPPEDAELWARVTDTADPLRKGKNRVVESHEPADRSAPDPGPAKKNPSRLERSRSVEEKKPLSPPPVASFDRKEARRLISGRTRVDARIDLHGMRQSEAYGSLKNFLSGAQTRGHRHVLVITGKGGKRESDGSRGRGVLNREAPRWLSEPEFRQWVVSFTSASPRHGGDGALYVRLRRSKEV